MISTVERGGSWNRAAAFVFAEIDKRTELSDIVPAVHHATYHGGQRGAILRWC